MRTEGQRQLIELGGSLADIANAVGCSRQAASNWRTGELVPSPAWRGKLFTAFGIPAPAWGRRPGESIDEPDAPAVAPATPPPAPAATPSTLADCLALHAVIRAARQATNLTAAERVKLSDTEARVLALRHRLEREADMVEDRIVREHPKWQALRRALSKAIGGCPRCSKLVLAELDRLDM